MGLLQGIWAGLTALGLLAKHPVLSVWQTDIIYYGTDLVDYIHQEFGGPGMDRTDQRWKPNATLAFWRDFL